MLNDIEHQAGLTGSTLFSVSNTKIGNIITAVIPWIFTISGMLLLIYLIFGGIQLMLSRGDPKNAQAAKAHVTNALIGFIIIFVAYWVVQLVGVIFNLRGINSFFGSGIG